MELIISFVAIGVSIVAIVVSFTMSNKAINTSKAQTNEISSQNLRVQLFDKRIEIYKQLTFIDSYVAAENLSSRDYEIFNQIHNILTEAKFLFSKEITSKIQELLHLLLELRKCSLKINEKTYKDGNDLKNTVSEETRLLEETTKRFKDISNSCEEYLDVKEIGLLKP